VFVSQTLIFSFAKDSSTMMIASGRLFSTSLTLIHLLYPLVEGVSFTALIPPYDEECYLIRVPQAVVADRKGADPSLMMIRGSFEWLDGLEQSLEPTSVVVLKDGTETELYRSPPEIDHERFSVPARVGSAYLLCAQNGLYHGEDSEYDEQERQVGLRITVEPAFKSNQDPNKVWQEQGGDKFLDDASNLQQSVQQAVDHVFYMKTRENNHREVAEETFTELLLWVLLEFVLLFVVAGGQIYWLRRFLEKRRQL